MKRTCPKCGRESIKVSDILFADARCPSCHTVIGVHRFALWISNLVISVVAITTSLVVLIQSGLYAALIWFPFPVGALSFIKARFSPLQVRNEASHT